jgi:hypothetical protein
VTYIPPIEGGTLSDYIFRTGATVHRFREHHPGVNQEAQDAIVGQGSADWEDPHGNN